MPKSAAPRKKSTRQPDQLKEVLERAMAMDRRRQAQIANQVASINRLLAGAEEHECFPHDPATGHPMIQKRPYGYTDEMRVLHEGSAVLTVENQDLRAVLSELVRFIDAREPTTLHGDVLAQARALVGLSAPVSEQGSAEG
jgi:hypothetical protein